MQFQLQPDQISIRLKTNFSPEITYYIMNLPIDILYKEGIPQLIYSKIIQSQIFISDSLPQTKENYITIAQQLGFTIEAAHKFYYFIDDSLDHIPLVNWIREFIFSLFSPIENVTPLWSSYMNTISTSAVSDFLQYNPTT